MKLSICNHRVNEAGPRWVGLLSPLLAVLATGCLGPIVGPADFRQRPQTVTKADPLGPYTGRVVDADNRRPVEGAVVWCAWTFHRGVGMSSYQQEIVKTTRTGPDGRYRLPRARRLPQGLSSRLARVTILVLHPRYVSYRHDRIFGRSGGSRKRRDFAQLTNEVRLSRWSADLSAAEHFFFTGGPQRFRNDRSTLAAAAAVLSATPQTAPGPSAGLAQARSEASRLLNEDDVRAVTGFAGTFAGHPLATAGDTSSTWHLRASEKSERHDIALRLWRLSGDALDARFAALSKALPGNSTIDFGDTPTSKGNDKAFSVTQGEIRAIAFMAKAHHALVLLTCGSGQCTNDEKLLALAKRVRARIASLPKKGDAQ